VLLGLVGLFIIAPLTLTGLYLFGVQTMSPEYYAIFKGIWAGLMASLLVVPMLLIALRENTSTGTTATHGS
jgi:preprotein translocase subunit SecF